MTRVGATPGVSDPSQVSAFPNSLLNISSWLSQLFVVQHIQNLPHLLPFLRLRGPLYQWTCFAYYILGLHEYLHHLSRLSSQKPGFLNSQSSQTSGVVSVISGISLQFAAPLMPPFLLLYNRSSSHSLFIRLLNGLPARMVPSRMYLLGSL